MKMNKKDFDKLSQLDRIEFRQRMNIIDKIFSGSVLVSFIYFFLFVIAFILLMYVGLLNIALEPAKNFMIGMLPLITVMKVVFLVAFIFDIAIIIIKMKHRKRLIKEYFDCIKPKSKK